MLILSEIYNGEYKKCPRCKGYKLIRGQKINSNSSSQLPNYKNIYNGSCHLCKETGKAFYTTDNRVLKATVGKDGKDYIIEYEPKKGNKIGLVPKYEYINYSTTLNTNELYNLTEDDLFPDAYELIWCDWSKVADVIFEEYLNARATMINDFDDYEKGYCINFLFYYDKNGEPIKPFYIHPQECFDNYSEKGIILINDYIFGVSGTYIEEEKKLILGVKTSLGFKYYEVDNIEYSKKLSNEILSFNMYKDISSLNTDTYIKNMAYLVLKDIYNTLNK